MSEKQHITTFSADIEQQTVKKVVWRILPFLIICYLIAIIDRGNIGMASLQMNEDLGLSKAVFGFASSLFFVGYFLFEVPSNLAMQKIGAKIWKSDKTGTGIGVVFRADDYAGQSEDHRFLYGDITSGDLAG